MDGLSGALGDSVAQFYYVYDRLESQVQSQVLPQLATAEQEQFWSYQSILDQLSRALDNPNKTQEAVDRLHRIDQASESIPNYIAKFERMLYEAKGHNWDDDRKISAFRFGLNSTIKNRLAQQLELPSSYPQFLRAVQKLSSRSGTLGPLNPTHNPSSRPHTANAPPATARYGDPMDVSNIGINSIEVPGHFLFSEPTRQSYRDIGACLRCGSFDHWLKDCHELARPSANSRSAGTSGKKVTIATLDDDYDSDDYDYEKDDPRHPDAWQRNIFET